MTPASFHAVPASRDTIAAVETRLESRLRAKYKFSTALGEDLLVPSPTSVISCFSPTSSNSTSPASHSTSPSPRQNPFPVEAGRHEVAESIHQIMHSSDKRVEPSYSDERPRALSDGFAGSPNAEGGLGSPRSSKRSYRLGLRSILGRGKHGDKAEGPFTSHGERHSHGHVEQVIVGSGQTAFSIVVSSTSGAIWLEEMEKRKSHHTQCGRGSDPIDIAVSRSYGQVRASGKSEQHGATDRESQVAKHVTAYPRSISKPGGPDDGDTDDLDDDEEPWEEVHGREGEPHRQYGQRKNTPPKLPRPPSVSQKQPVLLESGEYSPDVTRTQSVGRAQVREQTHLQGAEDLRGGWKSMRLRIPHRSMGGDQDGAPLLFAVNPNVSPTMSVDSRMSSAASSPAMFNIPPVMGSPLFFQPSAFPSASSTSGMLSGFPLQFPAARSVIRRQSNVSLSPSDEKVPHLTASEPAAIEGRPGGAVRFPKALSTPGKMGREEEGEEDWVDEEGEEEGEDGGNSAGAAGEDSASVYELQGERQMIPTTHSYAFDVDGLNPEGIELKDDTERDPGEESAGHSPTTIPEMGDSGRVEEEEEKEGGEEGNDRVEEGACDPNLDQNSLIPPSLGTIGRDAIGSLSSRTYTDEYGIQWHKRGPLTEKAAVEFNTDAVALPRVVDRYGFVVGEEEEGEERGAGNEGVEGEEREEAEERAGGDEVPAMTRDDKLTLLR